MSLLPILLADTYDLLVREGDRVTIGQVLAKRRPQKIVSIPLSSELGVHAKDIQKHLYKQPGNIVTPGEIIARKKGFLGSTAVQVVSKVDGKVITMNSSTGELLIEIHEKNNQHISEIISPLEGTIIVCNNEKIVIKTDKGVIAGTKGFGAQVTARLKVLDDIDTVDAYFIQADDIGKIIVGRYFPKEVLVKSASIGIGGIIGEKILDSDLYFLSEKKLLVPILEVSNQSIEQLQEWNGQNVYLDPEMKTVILLHT